MKQYQIMSADLQGSFISFEEWDRQEALDLYRNDFKSAPPSDHRHGTVLVLHEFETAEEKDARRLDWLEANPLPAEIVGGAEDGHQGKAWAVAAHSGTLRETLDVMRNAPKDSVTIIDRPEMP